ncbi:MAG: NAD(P)/FAD-dependent oxidoreductase [Chitinophagaceae bacterium]|nr:NAD(P)/FAD-dependent oxidoreductase [Chitinophagaceae bacterium]MCW5927249.1 NAD(P)/FAD-dependent oxidoreductase [Chitinophagaceae bacterium]
MKKHYQVLIIGGGTAGIMVAAQLKRKRAGLDIAIVEPSRDHWYQPAWTLVGAGNFNYAATRRDESSVIPKGVDWVMDSATALLPQENAIDTAGNGKITYDYLVVAPGLVNDLSLIEGLEEALDKGVACSNYINPEYTWECLRNFKGGNALFTQPATPIKCGGAPQKIMYLAADYIQKKGLASESNVIFATPGTVIFGVKQVADTLTHVLHRYHVDFRPFHSPVKIDADSRRAFFKITGGNPEIKIDNTTGEKMEEDSIISIPFDLLHLAPPQTAPAFVKTSALANAAGWLDVNINSMQHSKYSNVFGLGDVAALPTAKTGAAIRKQAPVVVDNLLRLMDHKPADNNSYDGYSSCPLVTGYGKMVLAEFNYKNEFTPDPMLKWMGVFDSYKEHWRLWMLKKYGLPYLYWNQMLKGKM